MVFDLDGVLSDAAGRQHFLDDTRGRKDWRAFFDACGDDPLIAETARMLELLDPGLVVVLLTARPLRVQAETLAWLTRYGVRWNLLVMRPGAEQRPTAVFKTDVVLGLRDQGFDVRLAFEDDRRNVEALRAAGVPCVYLHSGYYD